MVKGPDTKTYCAGECQEKFTELDWMVSQSWVGIAVELVVRWWAAGNDESTEAEKLHR
jgi:hypothetical protein